MGVTSDLDSVTTSGNEHGTEHDGTAGAPLVKTVNVTVEFEGASSIW